MLNLRTPKGTVDLNPSQTLTQNEIIKIVRTIFERHNGVPITTPTFELREILMNKYGDDTKLIYNLEDQGGDICSLRYDLTVPFSRYLCINRVQKLRKYQIGNVFRRDNPSFKTGRLREFIQADFDICGAGLPMVNDAEALKMINDILLAFNLPHKFNIKINDRRILMGIMKSANIPESDIGSICSTVDKVQKMSKSDLEHEFKTKGLTDEQIEKVNRFIYYKGTNEEVIAMLRSSAIDDESFKVAIDEIDLLFKYIEIYGIKTVVFDLSLARGLEYYTGIIIEACYEGVDVGSVAGGGRYDNLCNSLSNGTFNVPCVGFSIGITRIFALFPEVKPDYDIFVGSGYDLLVEDRMSVLNKVWNAGFKAETFTTKRVNYKDQISYCANNNFKIAIFTGKNEVEQGIYVIVDIKSMEKTQIKREELEEFLLNLKLNKLHIN